MVTINFTFDNNLYELVNVSCTNITCDKNQTISFTMPDSDVNIIARVKGKNRTKIFCRRFMGIIALNTSSDVYKVGDTKQVLIGNKSYKVRIANKSMPEECTREDFSQIACGFVVEFVDIIEQRQMNSSYTNVGGVPTMKLHRYANGDFFNKLPEELRNVIINTTVVSGHGWSNSSSNRSDGNWESQDKIYLLNTTEVWSGLISRDRGYNKTIQ